MKRDNVNYLTVGIVVLAAFTLMLYVLYRLSGGVSENDHYYVHYANVGGLSAGTPVTYEGYKLGSVSAITPRKHNGKTRYRVDLVLRDGWQIPIDSVARIYSEGLLAETVINIEEGASQEQLQPGAELTGQQSADVFAVINEVAGDASKLMEQTVRPLLDVLNARVSSVGGQLDNELPLLLQDLRHLVATLQEGANRVPGMLSDNTEQKVSRILINAEEISDNILKLSQVLLQTGAAADQVLTKSEAFINQASGLVAENQETFHQSVVALRQSLQGAANYTEGIMHNLAGASRNMNEFSRQIRDNPGSLLGGKPPREEGVPRE